MGPPLGLSSCSLPSTVLDPLCEPGQAATGLDAGAAGAVVADAQHDQAGLVRHLNRGMPSVAVLGDVGEQLGDAEVGDGLDRGGRPLGQIDDHLDRQVAAGGERGERGAESFVQHRRVDAAGQVAQLADRLHGASVGRIDQLESALEVALSGAG